MYPSWLILSLITAAATVVIAFWSWRQGKATETMVKLQKAVEEERNRVELILVWEFRQGNAVSTGVPLRIYNASRNGCVVERVEVTAIAAGSRQTTATASAKISGPPIVKPFSDLEVALQEGFSDLTSILGVTPSQRMPFQFWFAIHFRGPGGGHSTCQSNTYSGVFLLGDVGEVSETHV